MPAATAAPGPLRRVVALLQDNIQRLELQRNKPKTGNQNEQKNGERPEHLPMLLEYTWDLTKQVMGIAVLSENEAKKQARKDISLRKAQDLQLVQNVLLIVALMEQMDDPVARADFLSGNCGATQIASEDIEILDKIYPEISSKPVTEEGIPPFETQTLESAKHMMSIIEGDAGEIVGTTYAHIKEIINSINQCGYFNHPREVVVEEVEEQVIPVREEPPVEVEPVPPPTPLVPVNMPPPAPQPIPAPVFSIIAPRAPPVTLQQVEHAYFAQYNHPQQHPPVPEVIGPQSFIFLQESELDSADISQQPTPRPASPASIPSQTFTNQSFTIPQHFTPDLIQNPHIPIADIPVQPVHYAPADPNGHIPNYTSANPPPPIPMPPSHPLPPHMAIPPTQVVTHAHNIPHQRLPSPSFPQPFKQPPTHPSEQGVVAPPNPTDLNPEDVPQNAVVQQPGEWLDGTAENRDAGQLEIDEWKPQIENTKIDEWDPQTENSTSESTTQTNGQNDKYRPRGRGRGGSGNYRGRGNYQNGRGGSYYKHNNDGNYQGNANGTGRNYDSNYRENRKDGGGGNRYENNQGGYQDNYRGRGGNSRGPRQNGGGRGGAQPRGAGGTRSQYPRKPANNQYEARNGMDNNKQFSN